MESNDPLEILGRLAPKQPTDQFRPAGYSFYRPPTMEQQIESLKKEIQELKKHLKGDE